MLNTIYEEDFLGFSYGFRPKRSQHDALDALVVGITSTKVNWILEVDVRSFFDEVGQSWLMRPANKAERSAAELVEQRAGTKGNADQH
jgi:RNA-directed DNA polymerase